MTLRVLSVGYPFAPVGPESVGGAEQVMSMIDGALVDAGQGSVVLAAEGSRCRGELYQASLPPGPLDEETRARGRVAYERELRALLARTPVDVIHMHGVDFASYLPPEGYPLLVTLHLPPSFYPREVFALRRERTRYAFVSSSQRRAAPITETPSSVIGNGVPLAELAMNEDKGAFALALGRICPEKGFHLALDAAARAGIPLVLAGQVFPYPAHRAYFEEEIAPRLDARRTYVGPVAGVRKRDLLARARCLLVPSLVPETSSLVAMEALASGTPVIAFAAGALADIVDDGVTGFLVASADEMAEAIIRVPALCPARCRRAAEERFSSARMTAAYLALFAELAAARREGER